MEKWWSDEEEENQKVLRAKLAKMQAGWGKCVGSLEIRRINPIAEIDTVPSRTGNTNPHFYRGVYSFYPTCGVAIAYYPETNEFASDPFYIDFQRDNVVAPSQDWVDYFLDQFDESASTEGKIPVEGVYMIYENSDHPDLP